MKNLRSLSVSEIMARTNWPRSTVYALIAEGRLPAQRLTVKGRFRVLETDLEAFITKQTKSAVTVQQQDRIVAQEAVDAAVEPTDAEDRDAFL